MLFESRDDMVVGMNYLFKHLRKFGLHMHVGRNGQASKTEAMFFPRPGEDVNSGDQSPFDCDDGIITFCEKFKYLGSYLDRTLRSDVDIDERIKAAAAAFGALRLSTFTNKRVDEKVKGRIFVTVVLRHSFVRERVLVYDGGTPPAQQMLLPRKSTIHVPGQHAHDDQIPHFHQRVAGQTQHSRHLVLLQQPHHPLDRPR